MLKILAAWIARFVRGLIVLVKSILQARARAWLIAFAIWFAVLVGVIAVLFWLLKFVFGIGILPWVGAAAVGALLLAGGRR